MISRATAKGYNWRFFASVSLRFRVSYLTCIPTRWLFLLGALIAIGPLSIDMYLPGFPLIEQDLGAQAGAAEFTLASFFVGLALGQIVYGPLSDRFGRKTPLLAGLEPDIEFVE